MVHGSGGGDLGNRAQIQNETVVRLGPAVSLCPFTLKTGLRYFTLLVDDLASPLGAGAVQPAQAVLAEIASLLHDHSEFCADYDRRLWPTEAPASAMFLRVDTTGRWRWYLADFSTDEVVEADPVNLTSEIEADLQQALDEYEVVNGPATETIEIGVAGINGNPKLGRPWRPRNEVLRQLPYREKIAGSHRYLAVREIQPDN